MKLWEVLKLLTDTTSKDIRFFRTGDADEFTICFLRPYAGSIEFRVFDLANSKEPSDNPILYPSSVWQEISKEEADVWLKGNYDLL